MATFNGIGVMSGTSLDGVDICCATFTQSKGGNWTYKIHAAQTIPYSTDWHAKLTQAPTMSGLQLMKLDRQYGRFLGECVKAFIESNKLSDASFVASHGHTIFHEPEDAFTCQIGDGETMAAILQQPVVTNFRAKDVALGGQGAPLCPGGERFLFQEYDFCLNLGGIANISIKGGAGYDVCACNQVLNLLAKQYDENIEYDDNGNVARTGTIVHEVLEKLNSLDFFSISGPKSLGREWVEDKVLPILDTKKYNSVDLMHTFVHHIANQVTATIPTKTQNARMLVTGGGAMNGFLIETMQKRLKECGISLEIGDSRLTEFKEAMLFAFLGLRCLLGQVNVFRGVTGATSDSVCGSIHQPPPGKFLLL